MKKNTSKLGKEEEQRALDIHKNSIVVNALDAIGCYDITDFDDNYLTWLLKGGVTVCNFTVMSDDADFLGGIKRIYGWYDRLKEIEDRCVQATCVEDIVKAKSAGKVAAIFGLQNAKPIDDEVGRINVFHRLGVRIIQLTYNYVNLVGQGCLERFDGGLSNLGVRAVEEMNKSGILVDLSHCGHRTVMDTIEVSKDPVAVTHANIKSLCDHKRNKTDEEIKALAEKGGVMGLTMESHFIKTLPFTKSNPRPNVESFLDQIEYIIKLVGIDHIGIGTDYGPVFGQKGKERYEWMGRVKFPYLRPKWEEYYVEGLEDPSKLPNITRGLVARGYSDKEIKKILGNNWLKLFEKVIG